MRYVIFASLLLVAASLHADPRRPAQFMISAQVCEISEKADSQPRTIAEPKIVTVANRPVQFHVGSELKLPKIDDIKGAEINSGTRLQLTCGEPREGKVNIDLKLSLATPQKREDGLAAVSEQSLLVQGSIPLGLEKRFALTHKDSGVQRYVLLKIEQVLADSPPSPRIGETKPLIQPVGPRIIIEDEDEDEEKLGLGLED